MKQYLFIFIFISVGMTLSAQADWASVPVPDGLGGSADAVLFGLPMNDDIGPGDKIGIFATGTGGVLYKLAEGDIAAGNFVQFTGANGNAMPLGDGITTSTEILFIKIYEVDAGAYFDLDLSGSPNLTVNDLSTYDNNSTDAIATMASLPVELTSFMANTMKTAVELNWTTATEINNDYFTIERSVDGAEFEALEDIKGNGTTTAAQRYSYTDEAPLNGTSYYRLKQTDFDGSFEYSKVVAVEYNILEASVSIFPNPVANVANIELPSTEESVTIQVMDISGRVIQSEIIDAPQGETVSMDVTSLQNGLYLFNLVSGTSQLTKKVMIQH